MSWLERRRPKRKFSDVDHRALPQLYRGSWAKAIFNRMGLSLFPVRQYCNEPVASEDEQPCGLVAGHVGECKVLYLLPVPQTAEQLRAAGMCFIGSGESFALDPNATAPAIAQDYDSVGRPIGDPREVDLNRGER